MMKCQVSGVIGVVLRKRGKLTMGGGMGGLRNITQVNGFRRHLLPT